MNIFVLDLNPVTAARMHCDKHIPKMCVEAAQMMASALRRHGATDKQMPLTKSGTPYKGGYKHHPSQYGPVTVRLTSFGSPPMPYSYVMNTKSALVKLMLVTDLYIQ